MRYLILITTFVTQAVLSESTHSNELDYRVNFVRAEIPLAQIPESFSEINLNNRTGGTPPPGVNPTPPLYKYELCTGSNGLVGYCAEACDVVPFPPNRWFRNGGENDPALLIGVCDNKTSNGQQNLCCSIDTASQVSYLNLVRGKVELDENTELNEYVGSFTFFGTIGFFGSIASIATLLMAFGYTSTIRSMPASELKSLRWLLLVKRSLLISIIVVGFATVALNIDIALDSLGSYLQFIGKSSENSGSTIIVFAFFVLAPLIIIVILYHLLFPDLSKDINDKFRKMNDWEISLFTTRLKDIEKEHNRNNIKGTEKVTEYKESKRRLEQQLQNQLAAIRYTLFGEKRFNDDEAD